MRAAFDRARDWLGAVFKDPYDLEPRVIDGSGATLHEEVGALDSLTGPRIALVSSWSQTEVMSRSLSAYLKELQRLGYQTVVISTSPVATELVWPHGRPANTVVVRRENIGYDFGSWAAALNAMPWVRSKPFVLLTNDSMVGPFAPLDHVLEAAESSSADLFGLTESYQIIHHPQSFFLLFKRGILADPAWVDFFDSVRPQDSKVKVIQAYELGLSRYCAREGYSWETLATAYASRVGRDNPTLAGWEALLGRGIPFVKRNLLVDPLMPSTSMDMQNAVKYRYGEDVQDWLPPRYELGYKAAEGLKT